LGLGIRPVWFPSTSGGNRPPCPSSQYQTNTLLYEPTPVRGAVGLGSARGLGGAWRAGARGAVGSDREALWHSAMEAQCKVQLGAATEPIRVLALMMIDEPRLSLF
jgi:hypothetical protein